MPTKVNSISELLVAVLPSGVNLIDCADSCGDTCGDTDCPGGCSGPASGCTNTSKGMGSVACFQWIVDPAALVELQNILVGALARTEVLRLVNAGRPSKEKVNELEKRFSAAVEAVRKR
ncbi:MAG TPA: hypothetical protein VH639_21490 [Bryobacteraceae bacterium]